MAVVNDLFILQLDRLREKLRNILMDKGIIKDKNATLEELVEAVKALNPENCVKDFLNGDLISYVNNEITSIRVGCFTGMPRLEKVRLDNALNILQQSFNDCTRLKHLHLPKVQKITSSNSGFISRTQIENLILPELVSFSDWYTFYTPDLRRLIAPKCTTIQPHKPFIDDTIRLLDCRLCFEFSQANLEIYVCRSTSTIPKLSNAGLIRNVKEIYVTEKIIESFKTATNWSVYADKIKPIEGSKYEDLDWYKNEDWYAEEMSVWE